MIITRPTTIKLGVRPDIVDNDDGGFFFSISKTKPTGIQPAKICHIDARIYIKSSKGYSVMKNDDRKDKCNMKTKVNIREKERRKKKPFALINFFFLVLLHLFLSVDK